MQIINLCFTDYTKAFDCVDRNKVWKILKKMGMHIGFSRSASWETYVQVRKQQSEMDMEQQTGSKLGKVYKTAYCNPAYLTYMQHT